jgi:hypothetical protein
LDEPHKTYGKHVDYCHLNNPFSEEKDDEESYLFEVLSEEEAYTIIVGDELTSLNNTQNSSEWPEWHHAMKEELQLLESMGTWKLEEKPPNVIPIGNIIRKRNKQGEIICYHA